jgi:ferredoxin
MADNELTLFEAFLNQHDSQGWREVVWSLMPSIDEVDKTATQIWFSFFPLDLAVAFSGEEDPARLAEDLLMLGKFNLKDQIDTSHTFLYGHRYWPQVKAAVVAHAGSGKAVSSLDLATQIKEVANEVARALRIGAGLVTGMTAVAFMTLRQVGSSAFFASPGKVSLPAKVISKSPEQVLRTRAKGDGQGVFGFLKGAAKTFRITFDENQPGASFRLIQGQELTNASSEDKAHFTDRDPRLLGSEGPIPTQCRAAACGTCWVGVLAGAEKLSDVDRIERNRIKEFGYIDTDDPKPLIRLACRAQGHGAVSIVVPTWNGVFGKYLKDRPELKESEHASL